MALAAAGSSKSRSTPQPSPTPIADKSTSSSSTTAVNKNKNASLTGTTNKNPVNVSTPPVDKKAPALSPAVLKRMLAATNTNTSAQQPAKDSTVKLSKVNVPSSTFTGTPRTNTVNTGGFTPTTSLPIHLGKPTAPVTNIKPNLIADAAGQPPTIAPAGLPAAKPPTVPPTLQVNHASTLHNASTGAQVPLTNPGVPPGKGRKPPGQGGNNGNTTTGAGTTLTTAPQSQAPTLPSTPGATGQSPTSQPPNTHQPSGTQGPNTQKPGQGGTKAATESGNPFQGVADLYNQWNTKPEQFWAHHDTAFLNAAGDVAGQGLVGASNLMHKPIDGLFDRMKNNADQQANDFRNHPGSQDHPILGAINNVSQAGQDFVYDGAKHILDTVTGVPGFFGNIASTASNDQKRQAFVDTASAFTNPLDDRNKANLNAMRKQQNMPPVNSAPWDAHAVNTALGYGAAAFTNLGSEHSTTPQQIYDQYAQGFKTDPGGTAGGIFGDIVGMKLLGGLHGTPELAADAPLLPADPSTSPPDALPELSQSLAPADGLPSGRPDPHAIPTGASTPTADPMGDHFHDSTKQAGGSDQPMEAQQPGPAQQQLSALQAERPITAQGAEQPPTGPAPKNALTRFAESLPNAQLGLGVSFSDAIPKGLVKLLAPESPAGPGAPTVRSYTLGFHPQADWGGMARTLGTATRHPLEPSNWSAARDKLGRELIQSFRPIEYTNEKLVDRGFSPLSNQTAFQLKGSDLQQAIHSSLFDGDPAKSPYTALARNARIVGDTPQGNRKVVQFDAGASVPHQPVTLGENGSAFFGEAPDMSRPEEDPTRFAQLERDLPYSKMMNEISVNPQPSILKKLLPLDLPKVTYGVRAEQGGKVTIPAKAILSDQFIQANQAALGRLAIPHQAAVDEATANVLAQTPDAQLPQRLQELVKDGKIDPSEVVSWIPRGSSSGLRLSAVMGTPPGSRVTDLTGVTRRGWDPAQTRLEVPFNEPTARLPNPDRALDRATWGAKQGLSDLARRIGVPDRIQRALAPRPRYLPVDHNIWQATTGIGSDRATNGGSSHYLRYSAATVPDNLPKGLQKILSPLGASFQIKGQYDSPPLEVAPVLKNHSLVARNYGERQSMVPYFLNSMIERSQKHNSAVVIPQGAADDAFGGKVESAQGQMEKYLNALDARATRQIDKDNIARFRQDFLPKFGDFFMSPQDVNAVDKFIESVSRGKNQPPLYW